MSKENRTAGFNEKTGEGWGLICLIPFGPIFFLASIIYRKNDVIKYGTLSIGLALKILHNYIVSFIIAVVLVMIICLASWNSGGIGGMILVPNVIVIATVTIVYNVVVEKILKYGEAGQPGKQEDNIEKQLRELKEQNSKQASIIEKLEKEIKKQEK